MARSRAGNGIDEMTWSAGSVVSAPDASVDVTDDGPAVVVVDLVDRGAEHHLRALGLDQLVAALPHHPGPVLRVLELLDEAGDLLRLVAAAAGRAWPACGSHTALHSDMPLMRWAPQSADIVDGGTPHTFSL